MVKEKVKIMSIIDDFKRLANTTESRFTKHLLNNFKKTVKPYVKFVNDDFKNDIEYLQDCIDYLNNLFNSYAGKNKCNVIETIRYMFDDNDEDYDLHPINNKQCQSFSDKNLFPFNEYLERVRPKLVTLMSDCCEVKLNVNAIFKSKKSNDKISVYIKSKNTTDIDEIFSQLVEKHKELTESLKKLDFIPEGIESITYNFTVINTFINLPQWIKNKNCTINPQNNDNKCFQYSVVFSLYHTDIKYHPERISIIKPFINNLNFPPQEKDYQQFEMDNKSIALNILESNSLQTNEQKISYFCKSEFI